jgi:hypothetical protein
MSGWTPADLLPAAWLVLLAVLLGRGLGRWGVPVPALAWAAFAGVLLALLAPSLLLGRVIAPVQSLAAFPPFGELAGSRGGGNPLHGDLLLQTIPWHAAVRRFLAAGEWPLWNPWTGAGAPLLANPQAQALQPLVWLALPLSLGRALGVEAALRVLAALVFTFVLLRHQGAGKPAALFGAAAFGGSGFLILYLGWPLASSAALLPLAVYATLRWLDGRDRASWAILALALAAVLAAAGRRPPPLERVYAGAGAAVYARPRPLERPFLPASASVAGAANGPAARPIPAWSRWTAANPDFAARSLVAPSPGHTGPWRVLVDGRQVPAVITNGTLVGAWLPAGELRLELLYRPPGFVAGCLAGALALALLVAVAVPPPAVGLRRPVVG